MKYVNLFDTQADYDATKKYYPNTSYIEATDEVVYQENDPLYSSYLTFEALQNGTFTLTVPAAVDSTKMTSVSYSTDDGANWTTTTIDNTKQTITTPTINAGSKVLWKGIGNAMSGSSFSATGNFNASGNTMSLLYGDNFANQTTFSTENALYRLFINNRKIVSAENMILPATTLTNYCYYQMFYGCNSLTTTPTLPATTLTAYCYQSMFGGCTSLTTAPELPATTLAEYCYAGMFSGCTSLTTVPSDLLPATTLASSCYANMFQDCTGLTTLPTLPATRLDYYCYQNMFNGCTSLTTVPSDLLPATTLVSYCYSSMFKGCTGLTTAPVLPATTLINSCYAEMFNGCSNLNSITMLATSGITQYNVLNNWVKNVSATGTFTKAASMTTLPTGASGIPSGWTVVNV